MDTVLKLQKIFTLSNVAAESVLIRSPRITTNRLVLRAINTSDLETFIAMRSDTETMQFIPLPLINTMDSALCWMREVAQQTEQGTCLHWAITSKEYNTFIGTCGLFGWQTNHRRAETGYMLTKEHRRCGFATEAMLAVLKYGFETLQLHTIHASVMGRNEASLQLLNNLGFCLEVVRRDATFWQDCWHTEQDFSIKSDEWKEKESIYNAYH